MKILILSLFILLFHLFILSLFNIIEISGQHLPNSTNDFNIYNNKIYSFELVYPSNWTYVEFADQFRDTDLNLVVSFISPLDSSVDPFQEFFTIKTMKLDPKDSFSNNFHQYLERLKQSITNVNISKLDDISNQSKYLKYSFSPQPGLIINKSEYIFLNNDNDVFHIEFTSNNNNKNFELLINKIISSIRIV